VVVCDRNKSAKTWGEGGGKEWIHQQAFMRRLGCNGFCSPRGRVSDINNLQREKAMLHAWVVGEYVRGFQ